MRLSVSQRSLPSSSVSQRVSICVDRCVPGSSRFSSDLEGDHMWTGGLARDLALAAALLPGPEQVPASLFFTARTVPGHRRAPLPHEA